MRRRDTIVGLALAAAVFLAWAGLLYATLFRVDWSVWAWLAPLAIAVQCWLFVGMFIAAHDAIHGTLSPALPWLNAPIGTAYVFLYAGFSYRALAQEHHAHHKHSGTEDDPDFNPGNPRDFWPWYLAFFRHYFGLREFVLLAVAGTGLALALQDRAALMLVFWALPAVLSSVQLFYFGTYLPHRHETQPFADHHNARSAGQPWLVSLLACFHFGHHHAHHAMPWLPWWRLPLAPTPVTRPACPQS